MNQIEQQLISYFQSNIQQALQSYDLNRDGYISQSEMIQLLQQSGYGNMAAQITVSVFNQLDRDRNGYITINDFQQQVEAQQSSGQSAQITQQLLNYFQNSVQQAFQAYDLNRDGYISQNEMNQILQQSGYANMASQITTSVFNQLDRDRNGYITINDFQQQVGAQQSSGQSAQITQQLLNYFQSNVQQAIQSYDLNRDGYITQSEMTQLLQQSGYGNMATQISASVFNQLDRDRNGYITINDFQQQVGSQQSNGQSTQLTQQLLSYFQSSVQQAIQSYDLNRDGYVTQSEMTQLLQQSGYGNMATQTTASLFSQLDRDRNGYITINDFQQQVGAQQSNGQLSQITQQLLSYFQSNVQQAMQSYDLNRDGYITQSEMIQLLQQSGYGNMATQITASVFNQLDRDQNGYITINDFQQQAGTQQSNGQSEQITQQLLSYFQNSVQQAFQSYDLNRDGYITQNEMSQILQQSGYAGIATQITTSVFNQLDTDRNGYITINDFQQHVNNPNSGSIRRREVQDEVLLGQMNYSVLGERPYWGKNNYNDPSWWVYEWKYAKSQEEREWDIRAYSLNLWKENLQLRNYAHSFETKEGNIRIIGFMLKALEQDHIQNQYISLDLSKVNQPSKEQILALMEAFLFGGDGTEQMDFPDKDEASDRESSFLSRRILTQVLTEFTLTFAFDVLENRTRINGKMPSRDYNNIRVFVREVLTLLPDYMYERINLVAPLRQSYDSNNQLVKQKNAGVYWEADPLGALTAVGFALMVRGIILVYACSGYPNTDQNRREGLNLVENGTWVIKACIEQYNVSVDNVSSVYDIITAFAIAVGTLLSLGLPVSGATLISISTAAQPLVKDFIIGPAFDRNRMSIYPFRDRLIKVLRFLSLSDKSKSELSTEDKRVYEMYKAQLDNLEKPLSSADENAILDRFDSVMGLPGS